MRRYYVEYTPARVWIVLDRKTNTTLSYHVDFDTANATKNKLNGELQ